MTASRPLCATSSSIPRRARSSIATIWLASLSSARSACRPSNSRSSGASSPRRLSMDTTALRFDDRVEQGRGGERLADEHVDPELGTARLFLLSRIGADHDDGQRASLIARADACGGVDAVHAGQHPVHDDQAKRIRAACTVVPLEQRESLFRIRDGDRRDRPASEKHLEQLAGRRGVVDDQRRLFSERGRRDGRGHVLVRVECEPRREEERRAGAGRALEGEIAAHQTREPPADRQPETSAAVLA